MATEKQDVLNVNIGILGHVDSGKTSLARAISTLFSTASLDKSAQSKARGITLDLGFSSYYTNLPEHLTGEPYSGVQFTFVDCPGHASLIRTIIGGAQIIDVMLLVIDITKGIQTQTAECLVIGDILADQMVVVLNKTDLLPQEKRDSKIEKTKKALRKVFKKTKFGVDIPMICVSANPGGTPPTEDVSEDHTIDSREHGHVQELIDFLLKNLTVPKRSLDGPFLYAMDHCFAIKGKGTVMTGTVLSGKVKINQTIEIPELCEERKVKSLQMFHKPVKKATQGDRVAILVSGLDAKALERGLVCEPKTVPSFQSAIAQVRKIKYYKGEVETRSKFHVSVGHTTVVASLQFFCIPTEKERLSHAYGNEVQQEKKLESKDEEGFDFSSEYLYLDELEPKRKKGTQFVILQFEKPITCPLGSIVIGSKLDTEITTTNCRLAFHGVLVSPVDMTDTKALESFRIYKPKQRIGKIDRQHDSTSLIGKDLFSRETDISVFVGMNVQLDSGEVGLIEGGFGKSGKFKVRFRESIQVQKGMSKQLYMKFKKYLFAQDKKLMVQ